MHKVIHHLRKQPAHIRTHILNVSMLFFIIVLSMIWVYSLGAKISNSDTQIKLKQDLQPFSVLKNSMVGGYNSIAVPTQ